jgi:hypothetical protein
MNSYSADSRLVCDNSLFSGKYDSVIYCPLTLEILRELNAGLPGVDVISFHYRELLFPKVRTHLLTSWS